MMYIIDHLIYAAQCLAVIVIIIKVIDGMLGE